MTWLSAPPCSNSSLRAPLVPSRPSEQYIPVLNLRAETRSVAREHSELSPEEALEVFVEAAARLVPNIVARNAAARRPWSFCDPSL